RRAQATVARTVLAPSRGEGAIDRGDGSVWNGALLGPGGGSTGSPRRAVAAARGASLRAAQQDRWCRRQGAARSGAQRSDPPRAGEVDRSTRGRGAPPIAL